VVEVIDSGEGIPKREQPRIFERFYRVDTARSRATGGTGLGLAIVRHVAEGHGGSIQVESDLGQGSTFRLRIPAI
jgi:signal transduction histidine kinase